MANSSSVPTSHEASDDEAFDAGYAALRYRMRDSDDEVRRMIQESLDDPRPDTPAAEVFSELRRRTAKLNASSD